MVDLPKQKTIRTLYYFHIRHTVAETKLEAEPEDQASETDSEVRREWYEIEKKIDSLPTPTKMYNDSFKMVPDLGSPQTVHPICVASVICEGNGERRPSPNDLVLFKLSQKGCSLVLCESKKLHDLQWEPNITVERKIEVMLRRNKFIADEIDKSLEPGETAVLFLGTLHNLENNMVEKLQALGINVEEQNESEYTHVFIKEFLGG
jgi:hypothetical protein